MAQHNGCGMVKEYRIVISTKRNEAPKPNRHGERSTTIESNLKR